MEQVWECEILKLEQELQMLEENTILFYFPLFYLFIYFNLFFLLFICAYTVRVISPFFPHPLISLS
jgi:hypothetical protein